MVQPTSLWLGPIDDRGAAMRVVAISGAQSTQGEAADVVTFFERRRCAREYVCLHGRKGKQKDRTGVGVWFGAVEDPAGNAVFDEDREQSHQGVIDSVVGLGELVVETGAVNEKGPTERGGFRFGLIQHAVDPCDYAMARVGSGVHRPCYMIGQLIEEILK